MTLNKAQGKTFSRGLLLLTRDVLLAQPVYQEFASLRPATARTRLVIIIKNECHSNIIVDRLQGCYVGLEIGC